MKIVPIIEISRGKCVRLNFANYPKQKLYKGNPLHIAEEFEISGVRHLHLVDMDSADAGYIVNENIIESIVKNNNLKVSLCAGITTDADIEKAFSLGVHNVYIERIIEIKAELITKWLDLYGRDRITLHMDCYYPSLFNRPMMQKQTHQIVRFAKNYSELGISNIFFNDIPFNGLVRPALKAVLLEIATSTDINITANAFNVKELYMLNDIGCDTAIVGNAIYNGNYNLDRIFSLNFQK